MAREYPTITRRYLSTVFDVFFILLIVILTSYILQSAGDITVKIRIAIILFMFFVYEPFFTSFFCTLGQKITGIRVRKRDSLQRISIPAAYLRTLIKLFLGLISFFTVPLVEERRALHGFAAGSVVIYKEDLSKTTEPISSAKYGHK